ncbi:aquaporin-5-like [Lineus longissimus]|uniref:aquaporin-5-like n=1 Tax=Lineus longissimus TaxID=88925 RepID=UPI002B4DD687
MTSSSCIERCRLLSSKRDVQNSKCWRAIAAECLGTILFVMLVTGCNVFMGEVQVKDVKYLQIALGEGLAYATMIWVFGAVSGGHFNPAITLGYLFTRRISLFKAMAYIIIQILSGIVGVAIVKGMTAKNYWVAQAATVIHKNISLGQAFGVETMITFVLAMVIFAAYDYRRYDLKGSGPLAIGLAVVVGNLFGAAQTTSSMNPALSLAAAIFTNKWTDHWVFWVGPIPGAIVGALIYDQIFATNASVLRAKAWWCCCHYEPNDTRDDELDDVQKVNTNNANISMQTITETDGRVIYRL